MALLSLFPGLLCICKQRIKLLRESAGTSNLILDEDERLPTLADFDVHGICDNCSAFIKGKAFIRDGIFRGIYEYKILD